jgi:transposase
LGGGLLPDFRTIRRFLTRHHDDFIKVFFQAVQVAKEVGLVKLGTLAVHGSEIKANAS